MREYIERLMRYDKDEKPFLKIYCQFVEKFNQRSNHESEIKELDFLLT
jgi:hypothetical protein